MARQYDKFRVACISLYVPNSTQKRDSSQWPHQYVVHFHAFLVVTEFAILRIVHSAVESFYGRGLLEQLFADARYYIRFLRVLCRFVPIIVGLITLIKPLYQDNINVLDNDRDIFKAQTI